jgi:rod shape determining protein RodA
VSNRSILGRIDMATVLLYLLLVFMGWFNIYAAVFSEAHSSIFDFDMQYGKQLLWIIGGLIIVGFAMLVDGKLYAQLSYPIYGFVILMLIAVLFFGETVNASRSWFAIGPVRIQPAEFAKMATCMAVAKILSSHGADFGRISTYLKLGIALCLPAVLILLQNDTGSALVYSAFFLVFYRQGMSGSLLLVGVACVFMFIFSLIYTPEPIALVIIASAFLYFLAERRSILALLYGVAIYAAMYIFSYYVMGWIVPDIDLLIVIFTSVALSAIVYLLYAYRYKIVSVYYSLLFVLFSIAFMSSVEYVFHNVLERHQRTRINVLFGLESDPQGAEYNVNQSKIAIGSGGFWGKGFLQGTQTKFNFVPEQSTDFIFCTVGEEWGFAGSVTVIGLLLALLLRILYISERQRSQYSKIYGYCVASVMFFHIAINIGMTIGLVPVIGIPLPFFSYGGSSLWSFTLLLFILLRLDIDRDSLIY